MLKAKLAAVAAIAVLASGCATHGQTGALLGATIGAAVGGPIGAGAGAAASGAFVGGVVGGGVGNLADKHSHKTVVVEKSSATVVTPAKVEVAPVQTYTPAATDTSTTTVTTTKKVRE